MVKTVPIVIVIAALSKEWKAALFVKIVDGQNALNGQVSG